MVEQARELAAGSGAEVLVADMRDLPVLGRFDLVTSIDDALNYLLSDEELRLAFAGVARNLRPGGLFAFDLNTIACFRNQFSHDMVREVDGAFFCLQGEPDATRLPPGGTLVSVLEVFATDDGDCWHRSSCRHVQRHHPPALVERLLRETGFELVDRRGQLSGAHLVPVGDEEIHMKLDYFARRTAALGPQASQGSGGDTR
jgi:predicted TPR repeat methyltransferase